MIKALYLIAQYWWAPVVLAVMCSFNAPVPATILAWCAAIIATCLRISLYVES